MTKVTVSGCRGRMGSSIRRLVEEDPELELAGVFDVNDDPDTAIRACDVLIEFTAPEATIKNLDIAKRLGKAIVIGTTNLNDAQMVVVKDAAKSIPIVFSPNMAVGVNLLFKLAQEAAAVLDNGYTVTISETHHVHKKDAPSGTAKKLRAIISEEKKKDAGEIKVDSHRIGEIVGDHTVIFDGKEERLELTHHAKSRDVFAKGAVVAAKFIAGKKPGLYTMDKVLGIDARQQRRHYG